MNRPKDYNTASPWNMRIWDDNKHQWLCDGEDDVLPYYGFDIRGGEVVAMQSMDWVYRQFEHGRKLIWERSTGLRDVNSVEIYEGDILKYNSQLFIVIWDNMSAKFGLLYIDGRHFAGSLEYMARNGKVVGDIHNNADKVEEWSK